MPDATNALVGPSATVLDSANNRALVTDFGLNALLAVDLVKNGDPPAMLGRHP
jgi:hypothetical protein